MVASSAMEVSSTMSWRQSTIGDEATLQRGFDITRTQQRTGNVPVVSSSGVASSHDTSMVKGPGVVIGRKGTLGTVFYIETDFWPHDTTLWVKDFHSNDPRYVYYFFKTLNVAHLDVGAANPTLNRNHIHPIPIMWPSLPVQLKIAAILSAYDDLIENNIRRIALLEAMAQALYREWFVRFRFPGNETASLVDSPLGPIPDGWRVTAFTDVADVLSGGTPKTTEPTYWDGDIPFFGPKDARPNFYVTDTEKAITEAGLAACNSTLYPKDAVFITARGTVGKVVMPAVPMAMNQSCYALIGRNGIDQRFLFLLTRESVDQLKKNATGAVFDAIVVDTFRSLNVVQPPIHVTQQFGVSLSPLFESVINLLSQNTNLRRTRDLLLPKLISGEIDVSEIVPSN